MTNPIPINVPKISTAFDGLSDEQSDTAKALALKLGAIGFGALFLRVEAGPVVTSYFFKPLPTSPLNKVMNRSEDLALSVGVETILIQRIRDEISIAVPNKQRSIINFDSCLYSLSRDTNGREMVLPILGGQDTRGEHVYFDLATQPHILIAGSTGAGKSVFLAEAICSLAVLKRPDELQLILVDTKQLDLTLFENLEHTKEMIDDVEMLHPVLESLLDEVRLRTSTMKGKARNIKEWNDKQTKKDDKFPHIVLVIDELADVIGQDKELAKNETKEDKRTRISDRLKSLAQISRAAGIHIIAATQRPSAKLLEGDIKTNFPTRISFKLPSGVDSRVVLDEGGAEALLGKGDYLYRSDGDSNIRRAHGAFVSMQTIETILNQHEMIRNSLLG